MAPRIVLAVASLQAVMAQHALDGIAKYTMAVSDPHAALHFASANFPIWSCDENPEGVECNGTLACGPIGRTNLKAVDETHGKVFSSLMFPHMVNATGRPIGATSVEEVEAAFDAKLTFDRYDQFMDYALVVYSKDIDTHLSTWQQNGVPTFGVSWQDSTRTPYWSVFVRIPHTQITVEVVSDRMPTRVAAWHHDELARLPAALFAANQVANATEGIWIPLAISKFASSLAELGSFYTDVLGATAAFNATADKGTTRMSTFAWKGATMQVRVIERAAGNTTAGLSVKQLEAIKFEAHNRTLARTFTDSMLCGVDKWYDNHWGIDFTRTYLEPAYTYDQIFEKLRLRNWPYAQVWSWNAYIVDPSGDAVQFDSGWTHTPAWANLATDDALQNLCAQGNCSASTCGRSTAACSAGLMALCPGMKGGRVDTCQDCVHEHYGALVKQGCLNPDFVQYCS